MKTIFVLSQAYPSEDNKYAQSFIHPRNKAYIKAGFDVIEISSSAKKDYFYDEVRVVTEESGQYLLRKGTGATVLVHAPNIRNHVRFLKKNKDYIDQYILFFHGHEVLIEDKVYPTPYSFNKLEVVKYYIAGLYDRIKIPLIKRFINSISPNKLDLVFVSKWMLDKTNLFLGSNYSPGERVHIINNGINPYIKEANYTPDKILADCICIRPFDKSKYSIDLVIELAISNPNKTFHIYGRGNYFKFHPKPSNVDVITKFISPKDMSKLFNHYKCAVMPTKADAQGLMMCEMATAGIPMITSDIDVCHEMLDDFSNVMFIKNDSFSTLLTHLPDPLDRAVGKFNFESTIGREIQLIKSRLL